MFEAWGEKILVTVMLMYLSHHCPVRIALASSLFFDAVYALYSTLYHGKKLSLNSNLTMAECAINTLLATMSIANGFGYLSQNEIVYLTAALWGISGVVWNVVTQRTLKIAGTLLLK